MQLTIQESSNNNCPDISNFLAQHNFIKNVVKFEKIFYVKR